MLPFSIQNKLFWDIDQNNLDAHQHRAFIVARVLERGTLQDWITINKWYGKDVIKQVVTRLRVMDKR